MDCKEVTVILTRLKQADAVTVDPPDAYLQDPTPIWVNGVPDGGIPKQYRRIARFPLVNQSNIAKIIIRRPVDEDARFNATDILEYSVRSTGCSVPEGSSKELSKDIADLNAQVTNIVQRVDESVKFALPVRHYRAENAPEHTLWMSQDFRCENDTCQKDLHPKPQKTMTIYVNPGEQPKKL